MPLRHYPRQFRQLAAYVFAGGLTAVAHYGVLIGLVELGRIDPVPATLAGFIVGALVSYALNRWMTFDATRTHAQAGWRFALIAAGGFVLTGILMHLFMALVSPPGPTFSMKPSSRRSTEPPSRKRRPSVIGPLTRASVRHAP